MTDPTAPLIDHIEEPDGRCAPECPCWNPPTHVVVAVEELERLRDVEQHFRDRWRHAQEAAARIDTAFSHGVPSGPDDPVTAEDWRIILNHARSGGV